MLIWLDLDNVELIYKIVRRDNEDKINDVNYKNWILLGKYLYYNGYLCTEKSYTEIYFKVHDIRNKIQNILDKSICYLEKIKSII